LPLSELLELLLLLSCSALCIGAGEFLDASHLGLYSSCLCLLGSSVLLLSILQSLLKEGTVHSCLALASSHNKLALLLGISKGLDGILVLLLFKLSLCLPLLLKSTLTTFEDGLLAFALAPLELLIPSDGHLALPLSFLASLLLFSCSLPSEVLQALLKRDLVHSWHKLTIFRLRHSSHRLWSRQRKGRFVFDWS